MSASESDMLDELRRRAAAEAAEAATDARPVSGEYIPAGEGAGLGADFDLERLTADTLELLLSMAAPNWLSVELPEDVRITRPKIESLGRVYFALAVKYLPALFERWPLEMAALAQTVVIVMPLARAGVPMRKPRPKPAQRDDDAVDSA